MRTRVMTAVAALMMVGAERAKANSAPVLVNASAAMGRQWSAIATNQVNLAWDWDWTTTNATSARLQISGLGGSLTTNFTTSTSNYLWQAWSSAVPAAEDVSDIRLSFLDTTNGVVNVLTAQVAVVMDRLGQAVIDPAPASTSWGKVRENGIVPYDLVWSNASMHATGAVMVVASSAAAQTNVFALASGYYGWPTKTNGMGYGSFTLTLAYTNVLAASSGVQWTATLSRFAPGTVINFQ